MKRTKRIASVLLALVMALSLITTAFAAGDYSITVKNPNQNISIDGKIYSAYKIFDATYDSSDHVAYTVDKDFAEFTYTVGDQSYSGEALINYLSEQQDNSEAMDAFAKAALKHIQEKDIQADGKATATSEQAVISLSAPGYYLVSGTAAAPENQTVTAACALTTAKPTAEINVKADAPSVDKKIVEGENRVDANTAGIGDSVNYEITSKVPNMKGYTKYYFVMQDNLSKGLTYNEDMVITVGQETLEKDKDYQLTVTENADGTTGLEIVFINFIQYKDQPDAAIRVTYSATVNQDASLDPSAGNTNDVKLIYSNNPNVDGKGENKPEPGDPVGETPVKQVKTFVTGLQLTKVDGKDNSKTLTGAKFEIKGESLKVVLVNKEMYKASENGTYYMLKNGTYTETVPTDETADKYDSTTQKYEKVTVVNKETVATEINATGYVDENGVLTFEGLGEGTYTITELVAPNGYNLLKNPITVVIKADATVNGCTWTVTVDGNPVNAEGNLYAFQVVNNSGAELPSTGGIGTTIFYVVGGLLVVAAGVLLVTRKRMSKSED